MMGNLKIISSTYNFKTQKVDGDVLYDSFELSFNTVNKVSTLTINNVDILQTITNNAVNTYSKAEVNNIISFLIIKI